MRVGEKWEKGREAMKRENASREIRYVIQPNTLPIFFSKTFLKNLETQPKNPKFTLELHLSRPTRTSLKKMLEKNCVVYFFQAITYQLCIILLVAYPRVRIHNNKLHSTKCRSAPSQFFLTKNPDTDTHH